MTTYYVYAYLRKKDGTPYYIGKGKGKRAYSKRHCVSVPKDKSKIVFLEKNLTELGAFALERRYIKWYGRKGVDIDGVLLNRTNGGEGHSGYVPTEETRQKLRGRTWSQEQRMKISKANRGSRRTAEQRKNISNGRLGKLKGYIWCYHPIDNEHRRVTPESLATLLQHGFVLGRGKLK